MTTQTRKMTPAELRTWRRELGITQVEASGRLRIPYSTYVQYEQEQYRGTDTPVEIPEYIALACAAVRAGLGPYKPRPGVEIVAPRGPGRPRRE